VNESDHPEDSVLHDRIIVDLLEGDPLARELGHREPERALAREYLGLLGLLGAAVEPIEPRPELRERVLAAAVGGRELPANGRAPAVLPFPRLTPTPRRASWPLALAASLAFALLGLSAYLFVELRSTQARLAELTTTVDRLAEETSGVLLADGAVLCKLWPSGESSPYPGARGLLVVASDQQHWSLRVAGLEPLGDGGVFRVWFVTESGMVAAGELHFDSWGQALVSSPRMPSGVRAVTVTRESAGGDRDQPMGERVLYGDEKMSLL